MHYNKEEIEYVILVAVDTGENSSTSVDVEASLNELEELAIDPEKAKAYRDSAAPEKEDSCSMCGNFCSVRNMNKILEGDEVKIFGE